jgi:hypothetical protein
MLPEAIYKDNTVEKRRSQYPGDFWVNDMTNFYRNLDIRHDSNFLAGVGILLIDICENGRNNMVTLPDIVTIFVFFPTRELCPQYLMLQN